MSGISQRDVSESPGEAEIAWPLKHDLFGIGISATTYEEAVKPILETARRRQPAIVSCHAVHAVVTASGSATLRNQVGTFEMITPDGHPVRWALNLLHQTGLRDRVYGPELMLRLCEGAARQGIGVYFYGGTPEVLAKLQENLLAKIPELRIAGGEAPPFRLLTPEEDAAVVRRIAASEAGLVFIGLGCPKQDVFAWEHRQAIRAVQVCVGAAFDFHAGVKRMAPGWMQRRGLEWLYRLCQEPRRLAGRYLVTNSVFLWKLGWASARKAARAFR